MNNRITIITVVFNDRIGLEKTIQSVITQAYDSKEYIIIDGGSTDGTVDVIKKYQDRIDKWISEPDKGIYDAMNKGIKMASGEWINFMNAGDVFVDPIVLNTLAPYFVESNDVVYGNIVKNIFGNLYEYKAGGHKLIESKRFPTMGFCHQASFVKTKLAQRVLFDTNFLYAADFKMMHALFKEGMTFVHVNIPVALYDLKGFSSNNLYSCNLEKYIIAFPNMKFANGVKNFMISTKMIIREFVYDKISILFPRWFIRYYGNKRDIRLYKSL